MRATGLRIPSHVSYSHKVTADYAEMAISRTLGRRFDAMRRKRNRSEYQVSYIEPAEARSALETAANIIAAIEKRLG